MNEKPSEPPILSTESRPDKPSHQPPNFWRRALRWALAFMIVFSLGVLLILFAFLIPARQAANQLQNELTTVKLKATEIDRQASQKIADAANQSKQQVSQLQEQMSGLSSLEEKNKALQAQLDQANLHVTLLSARGDVLTARMMLAKDDVPGAKLALSQTPDTLKKIAALLKEDQRKVAESMQDRINLALKEMDGDRSAAQTDLEVLANSLMQMENIIFSPR